MLFTSHTQTSHTLFRVVLLMSELSLAAPVDSGCIKSDVPPGTFLEFQKMLPAVSLFTSNQELIYEFRIKFFL